MTGSTQRRSASVADSRLASTAFIRNAFETADREALEELFRSLYPRVLDFVQLRMGVRLRALEEPADIAQETFIQALRGLSRVTIRGRASLFGWLSVVAENVIRGRVDYFRARKRDPGAMLPLQEVCGRADAEPASGEESPYDTATRSEAVGHLRRCLEELPHDYREVIRQRRFEGRSLTEVATAMDRSTVQAVSMLCRRAEDRLAKAVRGEPSRNTG